MSVLCRLNRTPAKHRALVGSARPPSCSSIVSDYMPQKRIFEGKILLQTRRRHSYLEPLSCAVSPILQKLLLNGVRPGCLFLSIGRSVDRCGVLMAYSRKLSLNRKHIPVSNSSLCWQSDCRGKKPDGPGVLMADGQAAKQRSRVHHLRGCAGGNGASAIRFASVSRGSRRKEACR